MTSTLSSASIATADVEALSGQERLVGAAGAMTLLRAGVVGVLGRTSPEERARIASVVRSMSAFLPDGDIEDAVAHELLHPGRTSADSIRLPIDVLWGDADEAVFLFRCGDSLGAKSSLGRALRELQVGGGTVLAARLLLSYFVQRVLGLAAEALETRQTLERACLHEGTS